MYDLNEKWSLNKVLDVFLNTVNIKYSLIMYRHCYNGTVDILYCDNIVCIWSEWSSGVWNKNFQF